MMLLIVALFPPNRLEILENRGNPDAFEPANFRNRINRQKNQLHLWRKHQFQDLPFTNELEGNFVVKVTDGGRSRWDCPGTNLTAQTAPTCSIYEWYTRQRPNVRQYLKMVAKEGQKKVAEGMC